MIFNRSQKDELFIILTPVETKDNQIAGWIGESHHRHNNNRTSAPERPTEQTREKSLAGQRHEGLRIDSSDNERYRNCGTNKRRMVSGWGGIHPSQDPIAVQFSKKPPHKQLLTVCHPPPTNHGSETDDAEEAGEKVRKKVSRPSSSGDLPACYNFSDEAPYTTNTTLSRNKTATSESGFGRRQKRRLQKEKKELPEEEKTQDTRSSTPVFELLPKAKADIIGPLSPDSSTSMDMGHQSREELERQKSERAGLLAKVAQLETELTAAREAMLAVATTAASPTTPPPTEEEEAEASLEVEIESPVMEAPTVVVDTAEVDRLTEELTRVQNEKDEDYPENPPSPLDPQPTMPAVSSALTSVSLATAEDGSTNNTATSEPVQTSSLAPLTSTAARTISPVVLQPGASMDPLTALGQLTDYRISPIKGVIKRKKAKQERSKKKKRKQY